MLTSTVNTVEVASASADSFTFTYPIHKASDLVVYINGVSTATSDGTNPYTVTVAANKASATIAFTNTGSSAPHRSKALKFERIVEYKQETDLANNSLLDAESLETSLDNIVMQTQQAGLKADVSFGFDPGIAASDFNTTASYASTLNVKKDDRKSKALAFDANGDITVSADEIDKTTDYQLEAKDWASKASGFVHSYLNGVAQTGDGSTAYSAKKEAADALASKNAVDLVYDNFTDRYLGAHATTARESGGAIGKDLDNNALLDGALYFDTTLNVMKVWNDTGSVWKQLTPTSTQQTNIDAAVADAVDIGKVAAKDAEIGRLGATAYSDGANAYLALLGTTAMANSTDGDIKVVADAVTNVNKVAAVDTEIGRLGHADYADGANAYLKKLGIDAFSNATTGHIKKVADVDSHVATLGPISADITSTAGATTEMDTIVNKYDGGTSGSGTTKNLALINSVHGKITEVGRLGTADAVADLAILGTTDAVADMNTLSAGSIPTHISTVAGISANVTTVAGISANVTTVAGSQANVNTVAGSIADVNRYANEYKIQGSQPGSPSEGDIWMDTGSNTFKVYNGTSWATVTDGQSAEEVNATAISMAIALG